MGRVTKQAISSTSRPMMPSPEVLERLVDT
jgi:hypothetical protein